MTNPRDQFERARNLGRFAARTGRSAQSNPYRGSGTAYLRAWLAGYHEVKREARRAA